MPKSPKQLKTKLRKNEFYCVNYRKRVADNICVKKVNCHNKS